VTVGRRPIAQRNSACTAKACRLRCTDALIRAMKGSSLRSGRVNRRITADVQDSLAERDEFELTVDLVNDQ
jgi:hypothetical protein